MTATFRVTGSIQLERKLASLPRSIATAATRREMRKQLRPVADLANAFWPGSRDDVFRVTSRVSRSQAGDSEAIFRRRVINMFVGAVNTPHAHLIEFGTGPRYTQSGAFRGSVSPQAMMQPAWDAHKRKILRGLAAGLWDQLEKVARR